MFKTIYPTKDATIYSHFPEKNSGTDEILELYKETYGSPSLENDDTVFYDATYFSRILIQFDLTDISSSVVSGKINGNAQYFLTMKTTEVINLPVSYNLYAYPISGSWLNGTGFANSNPQVRNGVSWRYRDSKLSGTLWSTSSYASNATGSFGTIPHGGTWYTSSVASQSFNFDSPDVRMDVTGIVRSWLSGSIVNNGFIIKYSDSVEQDSSVMGNLQFFSRESHTIFLPRLEVFWDNTDLSGTGSFTTIGSEDFKLYTKNLRESYSDNEVAKVRLGVSERYPTQVYSTSSVYMITKILPTSSYFQIQDVVTDDVIIPFHVSGTKVNCDSQGNYIKMDCNSLMPERYYKLVFRSEFDGGDTIRIIDENHIFKIIRN